MNPSLFKARIWTFWTFCVSTLPLAAPNLSSNISQIMANRAPALDDHVFSIRDLEREGSERLQPTFRDFYNGGAMDMIT